MMDHRPDPKPRGMSPTDLAIADSTLRRHRCQKTLCYRGWKVTRGPIGSFQFVTQDPNGEAVATTYGALGEAIDYIENMIALTN